MELKILLKDLEHFLEIETTELSINTDLKQLDEWDSLTLLCLIDYIESNFSIASNFLENYEDSLIIIDLIKEINLSSKKKIQL